MRRSARMRVSIGEGNVGRFNTLLGVSRSLGFPQELNPPESRSDHDRRGAKRISAGAMAFNREPRHAIVYRRERASRRLLSFAQNTEDGKTGRSWWQTGSRLRTSRGGSEWCRVRSQEPRRSLLQSIYPRLRAEGPPQECNRQYRPC
jgi:hypothetical protein